MSSLQLPLLLFSVNVRYQTSSNLHSVSQKLGLYREIGPAE